MNVSILSKEMVEESDVIKSILDGENLLPICKSGNISIGWHYLLRNVDKLTKKNFYFVCYALNVVSESFRPGRINPVVSYDVIREQEQCVVLGETDDGIEVEYGSCSDKKNISVEELSSLLLKYKSGILKKTDRKIVYFVNEKEGPQEVNVYRDIGTGVEYVLGTYYQKVEGFLNHYYINDDINQIDLNIPKSIVATKIIPLKWVVDKKTNLAVSSISLFHSDGFDEYKTSKICEYLQSDKFLQSIGVSVQKKEEKKTNQTPFRQKKEKITLEERIKRILIGNTRIPYLVGHPGIGKTQIAKSINKNCVSYNLSTFTPDSFAGKTISVPGKVVTEEINGRTETITEPGTTHVTEPEWHKKIMELSKKCLEKNERCVLFLDEFDKLSHNMQVFINGIVDTPRTIANWEIPSNVDIILAGNTEEYSDAAFNISGEVASRLTRIEVNPDYIDWLSWANKQEIDPIVKAFIYINPAYIIKDVKDKNGDYDYSKSLTPRSWDQKISEELKGSRMLGEFPVLDNYMDEETMKIFEDFINKYFELGIERILEGYFEFDEISKPDFVEMQFIINCLAATARTEQEIVNALLFAKKYNSSNENELTAFFNSMWTKINNDSESILKLRSAHIRPEFSERRLKL